MMCRKPGRGFTLVEMLVVMGIIAILSALLLMATTRVMRTAKRTSQYNDFQTIAAAIIAYKGDSYGVIPQIDPTQFATDMGGCMLCRTLLGPGPATPTNWVAGHYYNMYDCVVDSTAGTWWTCTTAHLSTGATRSGDTGTWGQLDQSPFDGHDGFGWAKSPGGNSYGPYLRPDQFHYAVRSSGTFSSFHMLDRYGNPICYYTANGRRATDALTTAETLVTSTTSTGTPGSYADDTFSTLYYSSPSYKNLGTWTTKPNTNNMWEYAQNELFTGSIALSSGNYGLLKFRAMLGDFANTGCIPAAAIAYTDTHAHAHTLKEQAFYTGAYLLWSFGPDGAFGPTGNPNSGTVAGATYTGSIFLPKDVDACDDVIYCGDW